MTPEVRRILDDIDAAIADAPAANYEQSNYDAGYIAGLARARELTHTPAKSTAPVDEYCAEYDADGNIRLNCGRGVIVALSCDSREQLQAWLNLAKEGGRHHAQYVAALALLDGRRCPNRAKEPARA
ncbi:hypothetical protein [Rhodococcus opacus]|uniref:hypothetical protein n=1 Tax=Rhodococcus opacus TaxID=37919 RepID=UPI001C45E93A|nr:hypothetical protein [Rhodococcus opacus]MBV6758395.1 hypothetical protein [Rhodococcus opacus]